MREETEFAWSEEAYIGDCTACCIACPCGCAARAPAAAARALGRARLLRRRPAQSVDAGRPLSTPYIARLRQRAAPATRRLSPAPRRPRADGRLLLRRQLAERRARPLRLSRRFAGGAGHRHRGAGLQRLSRCALSGLPRG